MLSPYTLKNQSLNRVLELKMQQITLNDLQNHVEKIMLFLSPSQTTREHSLYLAGIIDGAFEFGKIDEETRNFLYAEYVKLE